MFLKLILETQSYLILFLIFFLNSIFISLRERVFSYIFEQQEEEIF